MHKKAFGCISPFFVIILILFNWQGYLLIPILGSNYTLGIFILGILMTIIIGTVLDKEYMTKSKFPFVFRIISIILVVLLIWQSIMQENFGLIPSMIVQVGILFLIGMILNRKLRKKFYNLLLPAIFIVIVAILRILAYFNVGC